MGELLENPQALRQIMEQVSNKLELLYWAGQQLVIELLYWVGQQLARITVLSRCAIS